MTGCRYRRFQPQLFDSRDHNSSTRWGVYLCFGDKYMYYYITIEIENRTKTYNFSAISTNLTRHLRTHLVCWMQASSVTKLLMIYDAHSLPSNECQNKQNPSSFGHFRRFFRQILQNFSTGCTYQDLMHAQQPRSDDAHCTHSQFSCQIW